MKSCLTKTIGLIFSVDFSNSSMFFVTGNWPDFDRYNLGLLGGPRCQKWQKIMKIMIFRGVQSHHPQQPQIRFLLIFLWTAVFRTYFVDKELESLISWNDQNLQFFFYFGGRTPTKAQGLLTTLRDIFSITQLCAEVTVNTTVPVHLLFVNYYRF